MNELLDVISVWYLVGIALMCLEIIVPGQVLIWFGIGAIIAGIVEQIFPSTPLVIQLLLFTIFSVGPLVWWRKRAAKRPPEGQPLNMRLQGMIGSLGVLEEPVKNGRGRLRLGDTIWSVLGPDLPVGCQVRVIGYKDMRLIVAAADESEDESANSQISTPE